MGRLLSFVGVFKKPGLTQPRAHLGQLQEPGSCGARGAAPARPRTRELGWRGAGLPGAEGRAGDGGAPSAGRALFLVTQHRRHSTSCGFLPWLAGRLVPSWGVQLSHAGGRRLALGELVMERLTGRPQEVPVTPNSESPGAEDRGMASPCGPARVWPCCGEGTAWLPSGGGEGRSAVRACTRPAAVGQGVGWGRGASR